MADIVMQIQGGEPPRSFTQYIYQFMGHQRFTRILSVIDRLDASESSQNLLEEAVLRGYEIATKEHCLGMFMKI